MNDAKLALAFTTYQTNRLFLIGLKPDGVLSVFERHFDRPMGLWASPDRLYMNTRWQLWQFDNALPEGDTHAGFDRLYVPRQAHTTGDLDVHDIAVDRDGRVVFVNTAYSCLATLSDRYSFAPLWKPPFISRLAPEDRCHLNGLAMRDGAPAFVTAVSRSDVATGWRERRHAGGCVIDVASGEIVTGDLSMPHSPRWHEGQLYVLNSGTGELGTIDVASGRFEPIAFCPGFLRGLAFAGRFAIVGLSQARKEKAFSGLALDDRLREKDADARCGLWVVDLESGVIAHWLELEGVVIELYDVQVLPGVRRPTALGFKSDEIQRTITIDVGPRPIFHALAQTPTRSTAAAPGAPSPPTAPGPSISESDRDRAEAEYASANALVTAGELEQAIAHYVKALVIHPEHVSALVNLGSVQSRLGRSDAGLDCFRRAIEADPRSVIAHSNAAAIFESRGELASAIRHHEAALGARPDDPDLLLKLWLALYNDGRAEKAKPYLERAIQLRPGFAEAYNALGGLAALEENFTEALRLHEKAAALDPKLHLAHENVGRIHETVGRIEEAKRAYARAGAIRENRVLALHAELLCPPIFASTEEIDAYRAHAEAAIDAHAGQELAIPAASVQSSRAEPPFDWGYHGRDDLTLKRKYAALFAAGFRSPSLGRMPAAEGPWRVGFVITPGHEGVFSRCMSGIINRLDRRRFDVTIVCARTAAATIGSVFGQQSVRHLSLPQRFDLAVTALRAAALDLIYYWEVGTDSTNYFLPFHRLAPVQCTGWGWPDTSGAPELDYHLTSAALAPPGCEARFSETLVRMPGLPPFFPRPPTPAAPHPPSRFGLGADANLYVCAQTLRKIHPDFDAILASILRGDPRGAIVFVEDDHRAHGDLLRERWRARLPDVAARLVFVPRLSPDDYFQLVAAAHVALDPLYFGSANTAYDTLAAGVPIVTLPWSLPRGRYAAALCERIGVEECIASTIDDYVERAVALGTDAGRRASLSSRIRARAAELFDDPAAVTQLESFFVDALTAARKR
jgi:uncharacterized protein (TIGR03032 family)